MVHEELAGTAPVATTWILVEQPGPWGRQALSDAHLPPALAMRLRAINAESPATVLLVRHASRTARTISADRRIWVSHASNDASFLLEATREMSDDLVDLPVLDDPVRLQEHGFTTVTGRMAFICTHSGRDACCALDGRALVGSLADLGWHVWECSHIGGHRFAPTALAVPGNIIMGRLDTRDVRAWINSGAVRPESLRGLAHLAPEHQAALAFLMRQEQIHDPSQVSVISDGTTDGGLLLSAAEESHWRVEVTRRERSAERSQSCGGEPERVEEFALTRIERL